MCSLQEQPFFSIVTCLPNLDIYNANWDISTCAKRWQKKNIDKIGKRYKKKLLKVVIIDNLNFRSKIRSLDPKFLC